MRPPARAAFTLLLSSIPLALACSSSTPAGTPTAADRHVVLLFTSDEHSHLFAFSPERDDYPTATAAGDGPLVGGAARRGTVIAGLRKDAEGAGKDSLLLSSGDNQMGALPMLSFESDSLDYRTMKTLGYDVTTLGNHEFDFGPKALAASIQAAQAKGGLPPIVASNVHFSQASADDDDLAALMGTGQADHAIEPYRIVTTKRGVKVGFLGYVGINAAHVAPNKAPVAFSAPVAPKTDGDIPTNLPLLYKDLQPVVDKLRNELHADLVVALSHAGVKDTTSDAGIAAGEDTGVCQNVSGIDVILSGHAHDHDPKPMKSTNAATKKPCVVLNAGAFGQEVGRVDFTIPGDASKPATWDETTQALVPVNEKAVPDAKIAGDVSGFVAGIESSNVLAKLLSDATATTVKDDPAKVGDLYFYPLGATDFDVKDTHARVWLSADAMLDMGDAVAKAASLPPPDAALESAGLIRAVLAKGKTGVISAADAFNVVPLGQSPADGTHGYPMARAWVTKTELRAVFELALAQGDKNSDYDIGAAGLKVEFDKTRPAIASAFDLIQSTKGRVMRILIDSNHDDGFEQYDTVLFDRLGGTPLLDSALVSVVTSSYIAQFASDAGVTLKDAAGKPLALKDAILKHADGSEVKETEAFMRYLHASAGAGGAGKLASTYDVTSPSYTKRYVCTAGCP